MKLKDSITFDENPEGINQYTEGSAGGSRVTPSGKVVSRKGPPPNGVALNEKREALEKAAEKASAKAEKSGKSEHHLAAAAAHKEFAKSVPGLSKQLAKFIAYRHEQAAKGK